jgi:hypothetical protein
MSLKAFHLVFVVSSIFLMLLLAGWSLANYRDTGESLHLLYMSLCVLSVVGLGVYGKFFLKKLKHISYL